MACMGGCRIGSGILSLYSDGGVSGRLALGTLAWSGLRVIVVLRRKTENFRLSFLWPGDRSKGGRFGSSRYRSGPGKTVPDFAQTGRLSALGYRQTEPCTDDGSDMTGPHALRARRGLPSFRGEMNFK